MYTHLTSKPGEFRAFCNLTRPYAISELPHYLRREFEERGYKKGSREVSIKGHLRIVECYLEPMCDGFETTDRAAFEDHMKTVHGKRNVHGENSGLVNRAKGKWRGPAAKPEDTPVKVSDKETADRVYTCARCGLVAEVGWAQADRLWWNEHLQMCAGTEAGAA